MSGANGFPALNTVCAPEARNIFPTLLWEVKQPETASDRMYVRQCTPDLQVNPNNIEQK